MTAVFDEILDTLSDGKKHTIEDIRFRAARNLNASQVDLVLDILADAGFVSRSRSRDSVVGPLKVTGAQLTVSMLSFLKQIKELENKEAKLRARADRVCASAGGA